MYALCEPDLLFNYQKKINKAKFYFFLFSRVDIEIVIRDDSSGTTLSAREAVDLMNQKDVRNRLEAKKFKVSRVNQGS